MDRGKLAVVPGDLGALSTCGKDRCATLAAVVGHGLGLGLPVCVCPHHLSKSDVNAGGWVLVAGGPGPRLLVAMVALGFACWWLGANTDAGAL